VVDGIIYLIKGPLAARDTGELGEKRKPLAEDQVAVGWISKSLATTQDPAKLEDVTPGEYTLCAHKTMSVEEKNSLSAEKYYESLPVACVPRTIRASPAVQELTQEIP
jgi:hypothetical protein